MLSALFLLWNSSLYRKSTNKTKHTFYLCSNITTQDFLCQYTKKYACVAFCQHNIYNKRIDWYFAELQASKLFPGGEQIGYR